MKYRVIFTGMVSLFLCNTVSLFRAPSCPVKTFYLSKLNITLDKHETTSVLTNFKVALSNTHYNVLH